MSELPAIVDPATLEEPLIAILTNASKAVNDHVMGAIFPAEPRRAIALLQSIQNGILDALQAIDPRAGRSKIGAYGMRVGAGAGNPYTEVDQFAPMFDKLNSMLERQVAAAEKKNAVAAEASFEDHFFNLKAALELAEKAGDEDLVAKLRVEVAKKGRELLASMAPEEAALEEAPNPTGVVLDAPVADLPPSPPMTW